MGSQSLEKRTLTAMPPVAQVVLERPVASLFGVLLFTAGIAYLIIHEHMYLLYVIFSLMIALALSIGLFAEWPRQ